MCRHMHNRIFNHCFFNTLLVLIFPIWTQKNLSTDRLRISTAAFAWQLLQQKLKFYFPLRGKFSSSWVTWLPSALSLFSFSFNQIKWNNFWEPQIYLHVCFLPVYPFSHFLAHPDATGSDMVYNLLPNAFPLFPTHTTHIYIDRLEPAAQFHFYAHQFRFGSLFSAVFPVLCLLFTFFLGL